MALTQVQGGMLQGSTNTTTTIQSNGTTAITIDSSQNVGIGRTPDQRFQIAAPSAVQSDMFVGSTRTLTFYADATQTIIGAPTAVPMAFRTNDTERMRIDSGGNLCLGSTTDGAAKFNCVANGFGKSFGAYFTQNTNGGATVAINAEDPTYTHIQFYNNTGVPTGYVSKNGASAVQYITSSDYRLKENIAPMTGALAKVAQLKPCTYTWKLDGGLGEGFIAHELQEVIPRAVSGEKDAVDIDGNIKPQGIDASYIVATLTAAIQELKAELDATKAEVAALKAAP
jgi:hypothetical protein